MTTETYSNAEDLLKNIFECMTELLEAKEFSSTVSLLTKLGCMLVNCERASFWFWDKEEEEYWTLAATGDLKITIPEGTGIVGQVITSDSTILCNDPYSEPYFNRSVDEKSGFTTKSILCMPVENFSGEVIGAFQAVNKKNAENNDAMFDHSDIERLSMAVVYCEKSLESYLLQNKKLKDNVTGLKNKTAFYEYYNSKVAQIAWKHDTCMLIASIDNIDKLNEADSNEVLLKTTKCIKKNTSVDDLVAKWDDSSFIIVLLQKSIDEGITTAENIKADLTELLTITSSVAATLSFGVHMIDTLFSIDENIKFTAERLEDARRLGGNKII